MKTSFKSIVLDHIGLKIFALVLAVVIWLAITNVNDYITSRVIKDIPVAELNGEVIEKLGKVYTVTNGKTLDIVVRGRRSIVDNLTANDFYAYADLSELSVTNTATINLILKKDSSSGSKYDVDTDGDGVNDVFSNDDIYQQLDIKMLDTTMTLSIEDKETVEIAVTVVPQGDIEPGCALGKSTATPNIISVSGPETAMEDIKEIRAYVNIIGKTDSFVEKEVSFTCYNEYGEPINSSQFDFNADTVDVSMAIYPIKEVNVNVTTTGEVAEGYVMTGLSYNPKTVNIAGEKKKLAEIDAINVEIPVNGLNQTFETDKAITDYLPEDFIVADTNTQIAISIEVEEKITKKLLVSVNDIELYGKLEEYDYALESTSDFSVNISGVKDVIDKVSKDDIRFYIDVGELVPGTNYMTLSYVDPKDYDVIITGKIKVIVTRKDDEEEEDT